MKISAIYGFVALAACLSGCASRLITCEGESPAGNRSYLPKTEASARARSVAAKIGTRSDFHVAAIEASKAPTQFPFYLLGFEKPRDNTERPYCDSRSSSCEGQYFDVSRFQGSSGDDADEIAATRKDLGERLFEDDRSMVLTHAVRYSASSPACYLANVYADASSGGWCDNYVSLDTGNRRWSQKSWSTLTALKADIARQAATTRPTHLILLSTGWNTQEAESLADYEFLLRNLAKDFEGQTFRPIVVAIAWESEWAGSFWSRLPFGSWTTKGNDADEIGISWGNAVLNDVLAPVATQYGSQLVGIGHSFGSRVIFGAHYARDVMIRSAPVADTPRTLVGIEAAFPTGRFITARGKEHQYVSHNKGLAVVAITASESDSATGAISIGTAYVGGPGGLAEIKGEHAADYRSALIGAATGQDGIPKATPDRTLVTVYDASPFVACELKNTSSGSHSDIYDVEMGHFLGSVLRGSAAAN